MSDASQGPGWWQASDGKWYPPEQHPDAQRLPGPPPASTPVAGPTPPGSSPIIQDTSNPGRWKWWAAGAGIAVIVIAVIAANASDTDDTDDTDDTARDPVGTVAETAPTDDAGTTATTEPPATTEPRATTQPATTEASATTVQPATTQPATTQPATIEAPATTEPTAAGQPSEPTCAFLGVDDFGDIQVELAFTNTAGDFGSLEVTYVLLDSSGVRFETETAFVEYPSAGERFRIDEDTLSELPAGVDESSVTCQVLGIEEGFFSNDLVASPEPFSCAFVEVDDFGDIQIDLVATSPFDGTKNLAIAYALRSPDGTRFADSTAFVDLVAPGETVRVAEDTLTDLPSWADAGAVSCDVLGVTTTF